MIWKALGCTWGDNCGRLQPTWLSSQVLIPYQILVVNSALKGLKTQMFFVEARLWARQGLFQEQAILCPHHLPQPDRLHHLLHKHNLLRHSHHHHHHLPHPFSPCQPRWPTKGHWLPPSVLPRCHGYYPLSVTIENSQSWHLNNIWAPSTVRVKQMDAVDLWLPEIGWQPSRMLLVRFGWIVTGKHMPAITWALLSIFVWVVVLFSHINCTHPAAPAGCPCVDSLQLLDSST